MEGRKSRVRRRPGQPYLEEAVRRRDEAAIVVAGAPGTVRVRWPVRGRHDGQHPDPLPGRAAPPADLCRLRHRDHARPVGGARADRQRFVRSRDRDARRAPRRPTGRPGPPRRSPFQLGAAQQRRRSGRRGGRTGLLEQRHRGAPGGLADGVVRPGAPARRRGRRRAPALSRPAPPALRAGRRSDRGGRPPPGRASPPRRPATSTWPR